MGPPLMDDEWRYGGRIDQIAASIAEGRPNGMPSWRGKLTDDQIWKLAAYVRSPVRPAEQGCASQPHRRNEQHDAADAHAARAGAHVGHRRAMSVRRACGSPGRSRSLLGGVQTTSITKAPSATRRPKPAHFNTLFVIFLVVCAIMYVAGDRLPARGDRPAPPRGAANVVEEGRHHQSRPADAHRPDRLGRGRRHRPHRARRRQLLRRPLDGQRRRRTRSCRSPSPATNGGGTSPTTPPTRRRWCARPTSFTCRSAFRCASI